MFPDFIFFMVLFFFVLVYCISLSILCKAGQRMTNSSNLFWKVFISPHIAELHCVCHFESTGGCLFVFQGWTVPLHSILPKEKYAVSYFKCNMTFLQYLQIFSLYFSLKVWVHYVLVDFFFWSCLLGKWVPLTWIYVFSLLGNFFAIVY